MTKCARAGVGIMLKRGNEVLFGLRHEDPEKASSELRGEGTWTFPGGKVDLGETIQTSIIRELEEETGIQISKDSLRIISIRDNIKGDAHFLTAGFLCTDFSGEPEVKEPDEIVEWKWFSLDELPENIYFPSERIVEDYKSNALGLANLNQSTNKA